MLTVCNRCRKEYNYVRGNGSNKTICASCATYYKRQRAKARMIEYKGGKCEVCDYNKCQSALEFHHLDPTEKDFTIGSGDNRNWQLVKAELDKCILLCCRCHREIHEDQRIMCPTPSLVAAPDF